MFVLLVLAPACQAESDLYRPSLSQTNGVRRLIGLLDVARERLRRIPALPKSLSFPLFLKAAFFSFVLNLFLIEIKHIHLHGTPVLYVDDLLVIYACTAGEINILEGYIAEDVFQIARYCNHIGLRLNQSKTIICQLSTRFGPRKSTEHMIISVILIPFAQFVFESLVKKI